MDKPHLGSIYLDCTIMESGYFPFLAAREQSTESSRHSPKTSNSILIYVGISRIFTTDCSLMPFIYLSLTMVACHRYHLSPSSQPPICHQVHQGSSQWCNSPIPHARTREPAVSQVAALPVVDDASDRKKPIQHQRPNGTHSISDSNPSHSFDAPGSFRWRI